MTEHSETSKARSFVRRWGILGSGVALIAVGVIWAAIASGSTDVQIQKPNGGQTTYTYNQRHEDVDANYKVQGGNYRRIQGVSINEALERAGVDEWTQVKIGSVVVTNGAYRNKKPPVFFLEDNEPLTLNFLRPKSDDGPFAKPQSKGTNDFILEYQVEIDFLKISDKSPKPGQKVQFEVAVPDGGAQNAYSFKWNAGSAGSGTGNKFEITYPSTAGDVNVTVTATREGRTVATGTFTSKIKQSDVDEQNENSSSGTGSGGTGSSGYTPPYTPPSFPDTSTPAIPEAPNLPNDQTKIPEIPEDPTATEIAGELMSFTDPETGEPLGGESTPIDPETGEPAPTDDPAAATPADESIAQQLENESITGPRAAITLGVIISLLGLGAGRELERFHPRRLLRRPNLSGLRRLPLPWK